MLARMKAGDSAFTQITDESSHNDTEEPINPTARYATAPMMVGVGAEALSLCLPVAQPHLKPLRSVSSDNEYVQVWQPWPQVPGGIRP